MAGWLDDVETGSVAQPASPLVLAPKQVVRDKVAHQTARKWLHRWRDDHGHGKGGEIVLQVIEFYMVWLLDVDAAGFWYSLQDGTTFSLEVGDTTKKCKVRRGNDNVSWR